MRVVLYYPYIRTAHSSEKQLSLRIGKPPNPKTDTRSGCNEEAGIFRRIRRRQTANIRSTRPVIVREVPPNAENEKTQSQSQVLRPFPAIRLRYATTQVRKPPVETPAHAHAPRIAAARGRHPAGRPLRTAAVVVSRRIPRLRYPGIARRRPERKPRHPGSHSAFRHDRHRTGTHSRSADRHSGRIRNHRPGTPL